MYVKVTNKIVMSAMKFKYKATQFFKKENGDVNIVAIVILIAIAVALALFFKEEIGNLLDQLFKGITGKKDEFMKPIEKK